MGFCDPCPGEPKQLYIEYTYGGKTFEVLHPNSDIYRLVILIVLGLLLI